MVVAVPTAGHECPCVDRSLLEYVWTDEDPLADPLGDTCSAALFAEAGALLQRERPGERVLIHGSRDPYGDRLRFNWCWLAANGTPMLNGVQFGRRDDYGWLRRIIGFFRAWPET